MSGRTGQTRNVAQRLAMLVLWLALPASVAAADVEDIALDGTWKLLVDPFNRGLDEGWPTQLVQGIEPESAPSPFVRVPVPGPLEAVPGMFFYDGLVWYVHTFTAPPGATGARAALRFEQVNYSMRAWLDGVDIGGHAGGYDAFELELGDLLSDGAEHVLVLRVLDPGPGEIDGVTLSTTPHAKESWYENFGGILGSVVLRVHHVPLGEARFVVPEGDTGRVRVGVALRVPAAFAGEAAVEILVEALPLFGGGPAPARPGLPTLDPLPGPAPGPVIVGRAALSLAVADGWGEAALEAVVPERRAWSPRTPWMYRVRVLVDGVQTDARTFGFRRVELDENGLQLDGERLVLKGVLWQPHFPTTGGLTPPDEALEAEVAAILDTGFNFVRCHVRPAPPAFLDACDRLGLLVLEEPAIGWVAEDDALADRLVHEVEWMVARDHHHPSIVLWGVLNELSGKAYLHGERLTLRIAALDHSRPVLEDSGGFFGSGRYVRTGGDALEPMLDEHIYPPVPLPLAERDRLASVLAHEGPTFVSEFGYGTVYDAARSAAALEALGLANAERKLFEANARTTDDARSSGETYRPDGWRDEAHRLQALALAEMIEALRSNPRLDLLCLTQWQGVSHESSAGLVTPWGDDRPARAAVRTALAPLLVAVLPGRRSARPGETVPVTIAVVNDTGEEVTAALELGRTGPDGDTLWSPAVAAGVVDEGSGTGPSRRVTWPTGVSRVPVRVAVADAGIHRITARLAGAVDTLAVASPRRLAVVARELRAPDGPTLTLVVPRAGPAVRRFAEQEGFALADDFSGVDPTLAVVLVPDAATFADSVPLRERLAAWNHVWKGGAAVVLLREPSAGGDLVQLAGGARGVALPHAVPLPLEVAASSGNFRGRFHVARDGDAVAFAEARAPLVADGAPRLVQQGESELAPVAMLVGELPEGARDAMVTFGHLEQRLGTPLTWVPFGRGGMALAGLPLLDEEGDEPERDRWLARLVTATWEQGRARHEAEGSPPELGTPPVRLGDLQAATLSYALDLLGRVSVLAERHSALVAGGMGMAELPDSVRAARAVQREALVALIEGRVDEARELLRAAVERIHASDMAAFLSLESRVLSALEELLESQDPAELHLAYEVLEAWASGLVTWFAGDQATGLSWLGSARRRLVEEGRMAPAEDL